MAGQKTHSSTSLAGAPSNCGGTSHCVNVLVCTNALFLQHAAVCLASLLANNRDMVFNIVVASQPEEDLDEAKLRRSLARFPNQSLTLRKFAIPKGAVLPLSPQEHYTLDIYTRLWVGEFFPPETDRVLYLDVDLVVTESVAPLWHADLAGALMGAVDIPGSDRGVTLLGMRAEDGYFNSGVLLIDVAQWRATRAAEEALAYMQANPAVRGTPVFDQDALNACFHGRTKRLDYRWNVIRPFFYDPPTLPLEPSTLARICREARIIHFNGASKPWSYFCDHPRRAEYQKYLRMTEWRDFVPADRTPLNRIRKHVSAMLPGQVKAVLKTVLLRGSTA